MMPRALQVFVLQDGQLVASEVFCEGSFEIGSDVQCDLRLADELIAPVHLLLQYKEGTVLLIDQGSAVGTLLNGRVIGESEATSADDIHVGPYLLKLRQLPAKRASMSSQPSGYAGAPTATQRPRPGPVASTRATRVSTPLMPTPRPGGLAAPLARALASMPKASPALMTPPPAPIIPLRPSQLVGPELDVEALVEALDLPVALPPEATQVDARFLDTVASAPAMEAPLDPAELAAELLTPIAEEVSPPPVRIEDLTEVRLPIASPAVAEREIPKNIDPFRRPPIPVMAPAPSIPPRVVQMPVPVLEPQRSSTRQVSEKAPSAGEVLRVRVLWGRHNVAVRSFTPGEAVVAEANEAASLPLYGFPISGAATLAEATSSGWRIKPPPRTQVTVRDSSGRWQPAAATGPHGLSLMMGGAVRLSVGDVHVEFVRQLPPAAPKGSFQKHDWVFLSILFVLAVGIGTLVYLMPNPPKVAARADTKKVEHFVRALVERKMEREKAKPPPPKKETPKPVVAEKQKPVAPKPVEQAETLKAATESLKTVEKAVDKVATATKEINNLLSGLNKVTGTNKMPGGGKGAALAGLGGIPSIPSLNGLGGTGRGGGIGDLNGLGGPLTKGAGALGSAGGLGSGTAGAGQVRGVPVSVPKRPTQVQGQIDRDALARVINEHVNEMRNCYERALLRDPNIGAGKVTLEWTIGSAGSVIDVGTKTSTLKSAEVVSCLLDVVRDLKFPKPDGGVVIVSYPILFNSVGY